MIDSDFPLSVRVEAIPSQGILVVQSSLVEVTVFDLSLKPEQVLFVLRQDSLFHDVHAEFAHLPLMHIANLEHLVKGAHVLIDFFKSLCD